MGYKIFSAHVAHETVDNEVFIINTKSGIYYLASGYAAQVWNAIFLGHSLAQIVEAFAASAIFTCTEETIREFIAYLLQEELIGPSAAPTSQEPLKLVIEKNDGLTALNLKKYTDLKELVMLDPIHDVSSTLGWPFEKGPGDGQ